MNDATLVEDARPTGGLVLSGETTGTSTSPERGGPRRSQPGAGSAVLGWLRRCTWGLVVLGSAVGVPLVGWSYALSAGGAAAHTYYVVFWVGMLVAVVPVVVRLVRPLASRADRAAALVVLGLLTFVPKLLRNPDQPLYHDEYAHWREALDVLATGHVLQPNALIPIVQFFPGTSALTVVVQQLTGLPVWTSGQLVVGVLHVVSLFAVLLLGEVHLRSTRAGALAALVYAVNPSALYFDTQYAYESVSMGLFLWVLALTSLAARARSRGSRAGLVVAAVLCSAGCVVTHHLTTVFLIAALGVVAVGSSVFTAWSRRTRRRSGGPQVAPLLGRGVWWVVLGVTTVFAALWLGLVARPTIDYLSPYFGGSLDQLADIARPHPDSSAGREVLAKTVQPLWERGLTALAPVTIGLICLVGFFRLWRERISWSSVTLALLVFGMIYFPSVPFVLAPSGAEGARRSWGFTYVGIALLVALVVLRVSASTSTGEQPEDDRPRRPARWRRWSAPLGLVLFAVVMVGNVGGGLNDPYRFPGPFRWGTDTRSATDEARTVAQQLSLQAGDVRVVSDGYTALQLVGYGGLQVAAPSQGFPAWDLTQSGQDPSIDLAKMLYGSGFDYLVVDVRMAQQTPFNGSNYGPGDPLQGQATPAAYLDRLDHVPWANRVLATEHLRVYRLDLPRLGAVVTAGR